MADDQKHRRANYKHSHVIRMLICYAVALCEVLIPVTSRVLAEAPPTHPVTMADVIGMTRPGNPEYTNGPGIWSRGLAPQFSPDGTRFVVVLRRGDSIHNANSYSILLWRTAQVFRGPKPQVLVTFASSSNREAIVDLAWLADNETIAFLGEQLGEVRQLYIINVQTKKLTKLTNQPAGVIVYSISPQGQFIAYTTNSVQNIFDEASRQRGLVISTQPLVQLVAGNTYTSETEHGSHFHLFVNSLGKEDQRVNISPEITSWDKPFVSSDGKYVVMRAIVTRIPDTWTAYGDPSLSEQLGWAARYVLIKPSNGHSRVLLDSPIKSLATLVAWSPGGGSVALAGVYLPVSDTPRVNIPKQQTDTYIVEVDAERGNITTIAREDEVCPGLAWYDHRVLAWSGKTHRLSYECATENQSDPQMFNAVFAKKNDLWQRVPKSSAGADRPEIVVDEDMNTPPRLVALDTYANQRHLLLDLNPQFKNLSFATVKEISWKQSDGAEKKGGLYFPVGFVAGKRYPLVIQTHNWTKRKFWIDGPYTTAFAAQPLAGKGIFVLQVDEVDKDIPDDKEMEKEISTYEGAIDTLDQQGLVDRNRVGLIGFSRTCLPVKYALIHSNYRFAAASVTDGLDGGYFQFVEYFNDGNYFRDFGTTLNGGLPWGSGMKEWEARSPGFNLSRVRTPLRIVAPHRSSVLSEWEWFAGLSLLGKPVEMIAIENGVHVLQRPRDRIISQEGNVDWFDFWLNGHEDPDPTKSEQYARWRKLRKLQEANEAAKHTN